MLTHIFLCYNVRCYVTTHAVMLTHILLCKHISIWTHFLRYAERKLRYFGLLLVLHEVVRPEEGIRREEEARRKVNGRSRSREREFSSTSEAEEEEG